MFGRRRKQKREDDDEDSDNFLLLLLLLLLAAAGVLGVIGFAFGVSGRSEKVGKINILSGTGGTQSTIPQIVYNDQGQIISVTNLSIVVNPNATCAFVSVKVYGAMGDGVTDDTAAIQRAIDNEIGACMPAGTYLISATLNITQKKGFTLQGSGFASAGEGQTRIVWTGPTNGIMMVVFSSDSVDISNVALQGGDVNAPPGIGLFVTAQNALGGTHWIKIHDLSISNITGSPGVGMKVGSDTDDDIGNNNFYRLLFVYNKIDVMQVGIQTAANYYDRIICLIFEQYGIWHVAGTMTIDNSNLFGAASAVDDIRVEPTALEFTTRGNYHELLYNRTTARAYHFVAGARFWSTTVVNARMLTVLDAGGAVNPDILRYEQEGNLDFHDCVFNGLTPGTVYLRNTASVATPRALIRYGNFYYTAMTENIEGNWNHQAVAPFIFRDTPGIIAMLDSASPQNIFSTPYTLQGDTNYRVEGELYVNRIAGTTAHQVGVLEAGTAVIVLRRMTYIAGSAATIYGSAAANMATTQIGSVTYVTPSNSAANEFVTIRIVGEIRTLTGGGGTWIPQLQWSAAPGGAPSLQPGSFIRVTPITSLGVSNIN